MLGAPLATEAMESLVWKCASWAVQGLVLVSIVCVDNRKDSPAYCPRSQSICGISLVFSKDLQ